MTFHVHFVHNHEISLPSPNFRAKHGLATSVLCKNVVARKLYMGFSSSLVQYKQLYEILHVTRKTVMK